MPKETAVTAVFIGALFLFQCSYTNSPTDVPPGNQNLTIDQTINLHPENVGAVVGVFQDSTSAEEVRKLILYDYFNPSSYKICYDSSYSVREPFFSPDRKKILLVDINTYILNSGYGSDFILYDLETNTFQKIYQMPDSLPITGCLPIWNSDGTGFFFTDANPILSLLNVVYYYDLFSQHVSTISRSGDVYPVVVIHSDSLVVFTRDSVTTGEPPGFYYMDMNGNYISRLNSPHLLGYIGGSGWLDESWHFKWNDVLGLFVYSENNQFARKISVTNLSGTYYKNLTSDEYWDTHPEWIDNGNYIVFYRQAPINSQMSDPKYKIMIIDYRTGTVTVLLEHSSIQGCIRFAMVFW